MSGHKNPRVLFGGTASGPWLRLDAPISFWGGVDPFTGRITNTRHPQHGQCVTDTVLAIPATIGSCSASGVLLELIRGGKAPAAIVLGRTDAILVIGCIVGDVMGLRCPPVIELAPEHWPATGLVTIANGTITPRSID